MEQQRTGLNEIFHCTFGIEGIASKEKTAKTKAVFLTL